MNKKIYMLFFFMGIPAVARASTVQGSVFLEGQTDHAGVLVTLAGSLTTPSVNVWGLIILSIATGWLLRSKRRRVAMMLLFCVELLLFRSVLSAAPMQSVITDSSGNFYSRMSSMVDTA